MTGMDMMLMAALREMGVAGTSTTAGEDDIRWQAVFMSGPTGAGKSWTRSKRYLTHSNFKLIDPDEVKKLHPEYDPDRPYKVHDWSKEVSDAEFKAVVTSGTGDPVVVDGTGRDSRGIYNKVVMAKENGYRTFLVHVWVPLEVSLWRNRNRDRFVPERKIIEAYDEINRSFAVLKVVVDKFKVIPNYERKDLEDARKDLEVYPAPQSVRPPRPGETGYGDEERMVATRMVREAVESMRLAAGKDGWEPPRGRRKEWRRKNPDGSYEYSYEPPEGRKGPAKEETKKDEPKKEEVVRKVKEKVKEKVEEKKRKHLVRLSHDELKSVLSKGHYSIVSAGRNPSDPKEAKMKPDDEFFHKRHEQLKDELEKKGYDYSEVVGHYGGKEASFMVFHDGTEVTPKSEKSVMVRHASKEEMERRKKELEELGSRFHQDSVLHGSRGRNSIVFTTGEKKGKECGGKGWEEKPGAKDFYTDMKTEGKEHTKFTLNVDGCFKKGLLSSAERVAAVWEAMAAD